MGRVHAHRTDTLRSRPAETRPEALGRLRGERSVSRGAASVPRNFPTGGISTLVWSLTRGPMGLAAERGGVQRGAIKTLDLAGFSFSDGSFKIAAH